MDWTHKIQIINIKIITPDKINKPFKPKQKQNFYTF